LVNATCHDAPPSEVRYTRESAALPIVSAHGVPRVPRLDVAKLQRRGPGRRHGTPVPAAVGRAQHRAGRPGQHATSWETAANPRNCWVLPSGSNFHEGGRCGMGAGRHGGRQHHTERQDRDDEGAKSHACAP